jgi:hypothetical protein
MAKPKTTFSKPKLVGNFDPQLGGQVTVPAGSGVVVFDGEWQPLTFVVALYRVWNVVGPSGGTFTVTHGYDAKGVKNTVLLPGNSMDVTGSSISNGATGAPQTCYYQFISKA